MTRVRRMATTDADFEARFAELVDGVDDVDAAVGEAVRKIIADVRARRDEALLEYTRRYDGLHAPTASSLRVEESRLAAAFEHADRAQREALELAAGRIRDYHERQRQESWSYRESDGTLLG